MMSKRSDEKISRILFFVGILLLLSEIWKQIMINLVLKAAGDGQYYWWYFPFQLCSTPMYLCLLLPLANRIKGNGGGAENESSGFFDAILTYFATFTLLAGVFTFVDISGFSELGCLPLTIHSWVWHILMILTGVFCFVYLAKKERGNFFGAIGIFLMCCVIAEGINFLAGDRGIINMFYINPRYKMAQACFSDIAVYLGNGWGIAVYIATIIVGATILYIALLCTQGRKH